MVFSLELNRSGSPLWPVGLLYGPVSFFSSSSFSDSYSHLPSSLLHPLFLLFFLRAIFILCLAFFILCLAFFIFFIYFPAPYLIVCLAFYFFQLHIYFCLALLFSFYFMYPIYFCLAFYLLLLIASIQ